MLKGGCYCGRVRYTAKGEAAFKAQCHCRECQYMTGGGPNYFMMIPAAGFRYDQGAPTQFTRPDLERPVTREFCAACGTHLVTRPHAIPMLVLKVGTLDDPARYGGPQVAIYTIDKQAYHCLPEGLPTFERLPR